MVGIAEVVQQYGCAINSIYQRVAQAPLTAFAIKTYFIVYLLHPAVTKGQIVPGFTMNSLPDAENANVQGRLLVNVIEEKAHWIPHHTYMRYPPKNWESEGYGTITWSQYADTIDKVAHWLDAQLGTTTENDTIAYFGPNDLRYAILVPATIKTGRKVCKI